MNPYLSPIFLVGFQRSGTNMTVWSLDKTNEILLFNENDERAFAQFKLKELRIIKELLFTRLNNAAKVALFKPISDTPKSLYWLDDLPDLRILFCFRHFNDVVNSHEIAFGDKGACVLREYLATMLDDSTSLLRKLYGIEHRFTSIDMLKKFYDIKLDNNSIFALSWLFMNHLYFDLALDSNNRVLPLCYEKTVKEPKLVFKKICNFINIKYQNKIIKDIRSSSVRLNDPPQIIPDIQNECRILYHRLEAETLVHLPAPKRGLLHNIGSFLKKSLTY